MLCAAVAGCGTVSATSAASGQAAVSSSAPSAPTVGCASAGQATSVTIHRSTLIVEPAHVGSYTMTQRKPALVRALFGDFCQLVAHPDRSHRPMNCPADFGVNYSGTFYDGQRKLATFVFSAGGCQSLRVSVSAKSTSTVLSGATPAAAPNLDKDLAAVLGQPKSAVFGPGQQVNPGGPMKGAN